MVDQDFDLLLPIAMNESTPNSRGSISIAFPAQARGHASGGGRRSLRGWFRRYRMDSWSNGPRPMHTLTFRR